MVSFSVVPEPLRTANARDEGQAGLSASPQPTGRGAQPTRRAQKPGKTHMIHAGTLANRARHPAGTHTSQPGARRMRGKHINPVNMRWPTGRGGQPGAPSEKRAPIAHRELKLWGTFCNTRRDPLRRLWGRRISLPNLHLCLLHKCLCEQMAGQSVMMIVMMMVRDSVTITITVTIRAKYIVVICWAGTRSSPQAIY